MFIKERILKRYEKGKVGNDFADEEGNRLAHLAALCKVPGDFPGEGSENIFGHTPASLRRFLTPPPYEGTIPVFRRKTKSFAELSPLAYAKQFSTEYLDTLQFKTPRILQNVMRKTMIRLGQEDIRRENKWILSLCGHERKKIPDIVIRWINPTIGYGIFAARDLPELTFIGEYTGIVRRRKRTFGDSKNDYIFGYNIGPLETPYVIDAEKRGNFTRFINHSDDANLFSRWGIYDAMGHIFLFTKRLIKQGEQLTYEYGPHYWKRRPAPMLLQP